MTIGGRNRWATGMAAVIILAVVIFLGWLALPMFPAVGEWFSATVQGLGDWLRSLSAQSG